MQLNAGRITLSIRNAANNPPTGLRKWPTHLSPPLQVISPLSVGRKIK